MIGMMDCPVLCASDNSSENSLFPSSLNLLSLMMTGSIMSSIFLIFSLGSILNLEIKLFLLILCFGTENNFLINY